MRYLALCTDYDGTVAHDGVVDDSTLDALTRLRESGRKLIMVTGRELHELIEVCPRLDLFDLVVAENGALLYTPATKETKALTDPPLPAFVSELQARGVAPLSVGKTIVATWEPHEKTVLEVIRDLGLELQVIFNKGAVMVLPSGVNKASGLKKALAQLNLSPDNAVGVGDAENDHAFLGICGCAVAVGNALPSLKEEADFVTEGVRGAGVTQLIEEMIADDLASREASLLRHHRRRLRKHAEGELPEERSFFFRGPEGKLKLRASNLITFMDLGDGVDDETWLYHLHNHEVSRWLREAIKDEELADKVAAVENQNTRDADSSRREVRQLIESVYTLTAATAKPGSTSTR